MELIVAAKLYEVQKYCSITNHVWDGHWICCNAAAWKGLPDDLKTIVANNLNQSGLDERADIARLDASTQAELEQKGMVFNKAETESFRTGLRDGGFSQSWHGKLGDEPWQLLQKIRRHAGLRRAAASPVRIELRQAPCHDRAWLRPFTRVHAAHCTVSLGWPHQARP